MKCKNCGEETNPVIITSNEYSLAVYNYWKENNENLCLKCFLDKYQKTFYDIQLVNAKDSNVLRDILSD